MEKISCEDFSLQHTLENGQFFYYFKEKNTYIVIHRNTIFSISQKTNILEFEGINKNELKELFQLDFDLTSLRSEILDELTLEALEKYWGLRIMKQDLWQCLISFVCSSAANVEKIKMNIKLLSQFFGEEKKFKRITIHTFPKPGSLNNIEKIKAAKTGYRSKFIFEINKMILRNPQLLIKIEEASTYEEAKELLMEFPGVGSKVADCICLFSLGFTNAFPVDTWIKQIIEKYYLKRSASVKEIENNLDRIYPISEHRGIYQQYLFHQERNRKFQ